MQKFQFVKIDSVLAKYARDFRGLGMNVDDAIEWIGEALGFIKIASSSEEAIAFIEVQNYQADIPKGLHYIIQIARKDNWTREEPTSVILQSLITETSSEEDCIDCGAKVSDLVLVDSQGRLIGNQEVAYYRPYFDLQHKYLQWTNSSFKRNSFSPVTLANASFFDSLVCKTEDSEGLYTAHSNEYTIVQDQLRFNFKEGYIAVAYLRQMIDCETGYPMIPDDESAKAAITYYLGWKFKEREAWNHREGAMTLADRAEARWLKYVKQFKNKAKMPHGADQYQNLMEQHNYLVPNRNRYYGFFGRVKDQHTR